MISDATFKLDGLLKSSSEIPTIVTNGTAELRTVFWQQQIDRTTEALPQTVAGAQPVYVATGGGYGAFNTLIEYEKASEKMDPSIVSVKGAMFRDLPEFASEKELVRAQIKEFLGEEKLKANPDAVEQTLSVFYSDEVNTKIAKQAVLKAFTEGKSVAYESASLYPDTLERAAAAKAQGIKTVLLAGDKELANAIGELKSTIEPENIATSYQKFAARFNKELVPQFDEIRLYNVDTNPPVLIAEKKGAGQELEILDAQLYAKFIAKAAVNPEAYKSPTADANVIGDDHRQNAVQPDAPKQGKDVKDNTLPVQGGGSSKSFQR